MAVPAYSRWLAAGKPLNPAQPIAEIVGRLKVAFPRAAGTFGWYANDAHYQAVPAEDHTPYSQTGWPVASPEWWVFATDVMHRPDLGVDCGVLFGYWIAEARAGRMPWLKYLIWQATIYDVRYGWQAQASSGHYDHIHLSARTDHRTTGLGSWSITPTSGDDMAFLDDQNARYVAYRIHDLAEMVDTVTTPQGEHVRNLAVTTLKQIAADVAALKAKPPVTVDPATLAAALQDPALLAALARAVNDDAAKRLAS